MITSGTQGGTSSQRGRDRAMVSPSRSITTNSSHCRHGSSKLREIVQERSISILSTQRDQEIGEISD